MKNSLRLLCSVTLIGIAAAAATSWGPCGTKPINSTFDDCSFLGEGNTCQNTVDALWDLWCASGPSNARCGYESVNPAVDIPATIERGICTTENGIFKCWINEIGSVLITTSTRTRASTHGCY